MELTAAIILALAVVGLQALRDYACDKIDHFDDAHDWEKHL